MISFSKRSFLSYTFLSLGAIFLIALKVKENDPWSLLLFSLATPAMLLLSERVYGKQKRVDLALDWMFALIVSLFIFRTYPNEFFDDAGFVMRYLDNFSAGHFYAYNASDGPVFGISSPFQGILTGALSFLTPLEPEQVLRYTAFAGLIALAFFVIQIIRTTSGQKSAFVLFSLIVLFGSKMFLNVMKCGLESSMHIAIVLAVFWSYYTNRTRLMFFLFALAIFSKLDALPTVMVVGLFWIRDNLKTLLPLRVTNKHVIQFAVFTVIPLAIWILVAILFFGSPLPQSAYAKLHYHTHPDDSWFPFFSRYVTDGGFTLLTYFSGACFLVLATLISYRKQFNDLKLLIPGCAFIATMVLYYFYNPGEKMMWYYAMPDILLLLQLVISLAYIGNQIEQYWIKTGIVLVTSISFFILAFPATQGGKLWLDDYLTTVEYERNQIGLYLGNQISADDTLMTWHGLTGRYTDGYVLDMSGLNSKLVTNYKRNIDSICQKFKPNWVVNTAGYDYVKMFNRPPYTFDTAFYDITSYNYPNWVVYKRVSDSELHEYPVALAKPNIWEGEFSEQDGIVRISGTAKQFAFNAESALLTGLTFGITKLETEFICVAELRIKDSLVESKTIRIFPKGRENPSAAAKVQTVTWRFTTPVGEKTEAVVSLKAADATLPFTVVHPYCLQQY